jgi:hypothetical protein
MKFAVECNFGSQVGGNENCVQHFGYKACEKDHPEDAGVDVRIILKWILGK